MHWLFSQKLNAVGGLDSLYCPLVLPVPPDCSQQAGVCNSLDTGAAVPVHSNQPRPCRRNQQQQQQQWQWRVAGGACDARHWVPCCSSASGVRGTAGKSAGQEHTDLKHNAIAALVCHALTAMPAHTRWVRVPVRETV